MNNSNQGEYWEKRLSDNFGLHGTGFLGLGKNFNKWMYRIRAKVLERELGKLNIKPAEYRILDIGSGTGFYIDLWRQFGCKKVVGADITNVSVENLRKNFPEFEFYKMDIGNDQKDIDQIIDRQFDIVSAFDVLFHITDDKRYKNAFKNVYDRLADGGYFIFTENFLHKNYFQAEHQKGRTLENIEKLLGDLNFRIVRRSPSFVLMSNPIDSDSRFLKNSWRNISKLIRTNEYVGNVAGGLLFPIELLLLNLIHEGPSTEIMVCSK